jgi:quaternary ammonium compound-resistance protein SugE
VAWVYLALAGLFEIGFAAALKPADGFTKFWPSVIVTVLGLVSLYFLTLATREIPVGTAYAIWTGIGVVGAALFGILAYNEPATAIRLFFIATLIASIIGLKIATPS